MYLTITECRLLESFILFINHYNLRESIQDINISKFNLYHKDRTKLLVKMSLWSSDETIVTKPEPIVDNISKEISNINNDKLNLVIDDTSNDNVDSSDDNSNKLTIDTDDTSNETIDTNQDDITDKVVPSSNSKPFSWISNDSSSESSLSAESDIDGESINEVIVFVGEESSHNININDDIIEVVDNDVNGVEKSNPSDTHKEDEILNNDNKEVINIISDYMDISKKSNSLDRVKEDKSFSVNKEDMNMNIIKDNLNKTRESNTLEEDKICGESNNLQKSSLSKEDFKKLIKKSRFNNNISKEIICKNIVPKDNNKFEDTFSNNELEIVKTDHHVVYFFDNDIINNKDNNNTTSSNDTSDILINNSSNDIQLAPTLIKINNIADNNLEESNTCGFNNI